MAEHETERTDAESGVKRSRSGARPTDRKEAMPGPEKGQEAEQCTTAKAILDLQRTRGNAYVQRLLKSRPVQAKMTVNPPDDQYEREADAVGDMVAKAAPVQRQSAPEEEEEKIQTRLQRQSVPEEEEEEKVQTKLQRQVDEEEEEEKVQAKGAGGSVPEVTEDLEGRINAARGGGQSLPDNLRSSMEPALGHDLSQVRLHTDAEANGLSRQLGAKAFTTGEDVFFREGDYQPDTQEGRCLIGHELTHVVQQGAATVRRQAGHGKGGGVSKTVRERPAWQIDYSKPGSLIPSLPVEGPGMEHADEAVWLVEVKGQKLYVTDREYSDMQRQAKMIAVGMARYTRRVNESGRLTHDEFLKNTHDFFGSVADILKWSFPPDLSIWDEADYHLDLAEAALKGDEPALLLAGEELREAESAYNKCSEEFSKYINATTAGGCRVIGGLAFVRDMSFAFCMAVAAPAVVGAGVVAATPGAVVAVNAAAAAYFTGLQESATAASEEWNGLRKGFSVRQWMSNMVRAAAFSVAGDIAGAPFGRLLYRSILSNVRPAVLKELSRELGEEITEEAFETVGQRVLRRFFEESGRQALCSAIDKVLSQLESGKRLDPAEIARELLSDDSLRSLLISMLAGEAADFSQERLAK